MSLFSTLNYLINSYCAGKKEVDIFQFNCTDFENDPMNVEPFGYEPSQHSIVAILNFASQFEVLKSVQTGNIELNLN